MSPNIIVFPQHQWVYQSALLIHETVKNALSVNKKCAVMLTGGRSAEKIYNSWSDNPEFQYLSGITFYFTDERWVPLSDQDSNYNMTLNSLFKSGIPTNCRVYPIQTNLQSPAVAAMQYENILPDMIDVMLLGVGEDGHIASLFSNNAALNIENRSVVSIFGEKFPYQRITITRPVIKKAGAKFVLAPGAEKAKVLSNVFIDIKNIKELPARLLIDAIWLMDQVIQD
jgi:6-phosphogluconolactonase